MTADLHHLAAAYALDALDNDEREAFEAHYPTCEICTSEVNEFRAVAASLARSAAAAPPPDLKKGVMAEIHQTRQVSPLATVSSPTRFARSSRMVLAAAAALVLLGGIAFSVLPGSDGTTVNEVVTSLDAVRTDLDPLTEDVDGDLRIVWSDARDQVAVVGSQLGDPGVGKAYALWFLLDDGVAPAGLFHPEDGDINEVLDVDDVDPNGWGITIEPDSGSDQPTTDVIFAATL